MAVLGEVVFRRRTCARSECLAVFFLCPRCDRGQRYCSLACRGQARLHQRRCANRRYQQSKEGREDHRDRQQEYRRRQAQARVTDQGSLSVTCPALSTCGPVEASPVEGPDKSGVPSLPRFPRIQPGVRLCCQVCGRMGRFIDPFPTIPRRR